MSPELEALAKLPELVNRLEQFLNQAEAPEPKTSNGLQYLNHLEAAAYIGIAKQTLYSYVACKRIPHIKVGSKTLFEKGALDEWMKANSIATIGPNRRIRGRG